MKLYVDDERTPTTEGWTIARSYEQAVKYLETGIFDEISLDHDLGEEKSGFDVCRWMTENMKWPDKVNFHTANPVGRDNMRKEYAFYLKYKDMR